MRTRPITLDEKCRRKSTSEAGLEVSVDIKYFHQLKFRGDVIAFSESGEDFIIMVHELCLKSVVVGSQVNIINRK